MPISPETMRIRQAALVEAAQQLIREKGGASFSMRELALKAGVSQATPYNLVGSKTLLLAKVVEIEFARFRAKMSALRCSDPLERVLEAVDLLADHYGSDQQFYFGFMRSAGTVDEGALGPVLLDEARALFKELMEGALETGNQQRLDAEIVTDILLRTLRATVEAWYVDAWNFPRFRDEFAYSARLILMPAIEASRQGKLLAELREIEGRLVCYPRGAVNASVQATAS